MHLFPTKRFEIPSNRSVGHISDALKKRKALQAKIDTLQRKSEMLRRTPGSRFNEIRFSILQRRGSNSYPSPQEVSSYLYPLNASFLSTFPVYPKYS